MEVEEEESQSVEYFEPIIAFVFMFISSHYLFNDFLRKGEKKLLEIFTIFISFVFAVASFFSILPTLQMYITFITHSQATPPNTLNTAKRDVLPASQSRRFRRRVVRSRRAVRCWPS